MVIRLLLFTVLFVLPTFAVEAGIRETVRKIAPNGIVFVVDKSGTVLVSQNAEKPFVPASVAKIATAWLAMEVLGADYKFETRFFVDEKRVLYLRGSGDPFLVSEELAVLARNLLAATGKEPFSAIVLDTSYFPEKLSIPGIKNDNEAYNALNSALAANFNTIHAVRKGKSVRSAEKQTPITPIAINQFKKRGPKGRGRISLAQNNPKLGSLYAGELLAAFIKRAGGKVEGEISIGRIPVSDQPVYIHRQSRPLAEIVRQMLLGSNNYIANQIFLEVGAQKLGGPVSIEKSRKVMGELLQKLQLKDAVRLVEGSGISPDNRFIARGLVELLDQFAPHAALLKRTRRGSRYKTGTLDSVSTLAGYVRSANHGMARFVIALPGRTGKLRFNILRALEKEL